MNFLQCNGANYRSGRSMNIEYIVIHYTANDGDTANGNAQYFARVPGLSASAHYFVDENEVWQSVKDCDTSWHCGGGLQGYNGHSFYKICYNSNSIGVEMCSRRDGNGAYYIKDETVSNAAELVMQLMETYGVPAHKVIRHYDVTGKICPEPFVRDESQWTAFKARLANPVDSYKQIIQAHCRFSHPSGVWEVLDRHKYAEALYAKWALSYK